MHDNGNMANLHAHVFKMVSLNQCCRTGFVKPPLSKGLYTTKRCDTHMSVPSKSSFASGRCAVLTLAY